MKTTELKEKKHYVAKLSERAPSVRVEVIERGLERVLPFSKNRRNDGTRVRVIEDTNTRDSEVVTGVEVVIAAMDIQRPWTKADQDRLDERKASLQKSRDMQNALAERGVVKSVTGGSVMLTLRELDRLLNEDYDVNTKIGELRRSLALASQMVGEADRGDSLESNDDLLSAVEDAASQLNALLSELAATAQIMPVDEREYMKRPERPVSLRDGASRTIDRPTAVLFAILFVAMLIDVDLAAWIIAIPLAAGVVAVFVWLCWLALTRRA